MAEERQAPTAAVGRPVRVRAGRGAGPAVGERPVRLAAGPLRPARLARARPGAAPGRPADRRRAGAGMLGRARRPRPRPARTARSGRRSPTRTCTPRWSAGCWSGSARSAASCGPAAAATTRSPPTCGCTCATTSGSSPARLAELETALIDQAEQHAGTPGAGHDPPAARPAGAVRPPAAGARPGARPRRRAGCGTGTSAPRSARSGAGALAGSSLPLDPEAVAAELGFDRPRRTRWTRSATGTSPPSSASRRRCSACTCPGWARRSCSGPSQEFGWVEIDDAYATGSSIMPQKKNPDVAELARGKAGRLIGGLTGAADHAQGPAADLQPGPAGGQGAGVRRGGHAAARAARDGRADRDACAIDTAAAGGAAPRSGFALATDLAELLVRRGVPFREAHEVVGHLVVWCQVHDCELADVSDEDLAKVSPAPDPGRAGGADRAGRAGRPQGARRHRAGPGRRAARRAARRRSTSTPLGGRADRACRTGVPPAGRLLAARLLRPARS